MIDCHFHVFEAGNAMPGARYRPQYAASIEQWIGLAAGSAITSGVLVQPSFLGTDNSLMVSTLARYRPMLRGIAVLAHDAPLAEMQVLQAQGIRGIRLNWLGVADPRAELGRYRTRFFEDVVSLGWHVELHADDGRVPDILSLLPDFLPLVLDHFGRPATDLASDPTLRAARQWQVPLYVTLSGAYRISACDPKRMARNWLDALGAQRLLWASDWPHTNYEQGRSFPALAAELSNWIADDATRDAIASGNARMLYSF